MLIMVSSQLLHEEALWYVESLEYGKDCFLVSKIFNWALFNEWYLQGKGKPDDSINEWLY